MVHKRVCGTLNRNPNNVCVEILGKLKQFRLWTIEILRGEFNGEKRTSRLRVRSGIHAPECLRLMIRSNVDCVQSSHSCITTRLRRLCHDQLEARVPAAVDVLL